MSSYPSQRGRDEIANRFMKLCEIIRFGSLTIEVVDGLPKNITSAVQTFRLDLTDPSSDTILKPNKASHHDERGAPTTNSSS